MNNNTGEGNLTVLAFPKISEMGITETTVCPVFALIEKVVGEIIT